jgi:drug/metabolite transporter (DMT)-like permease
VRLIVAFASVYVLWGSTYLAIRYAIESLPPLIMAGVRFMVAGTILYVWMLATSSERPRAIEWRSAAIIGALLLFGGNGGVVIAQHYVPSSLVALMIGGTPLWVTLMDTLRPGGIRPSGGVWLGLVVGLVGIAILIGPGNLAGGPPVHAFGAAMVIAASFAWAFGSLYSRTAPLPKSQLLATGMEMLCGGALLLLVGLVRGEWAKFDPSAVTGRAVFAWVWLVVAGSLAGFTAYIWLLKNTTSARATSYAYVNPIVAVFLGWAIAGEPITARTLVAGAVIISALLLLTRAKTRA